MRRQPAKRSKWLLPAVFLAVLTLTAAQELTAPSSAQAQLLGPVTSVLPDPCDWVPNDSMKTACKFVRSPAGTALRGGGELIDKVPGFPNPTEIASDAISGAVGWVVNEVGQWVKYFVSGMYRRIFESNSPDFGADWFVEYYSLVFGMMVPVMLMIFFTRLGGSLQQRKLSDLPGIGFNLMFAVVGAMFLPGLAGLVSEFSDAASTGILARVGGSATDILDATVSSFQGTHDPIVPVGVLILYGIFASIGGFAAMVLMAFAKFAAVAGVAGLVILLGVYGSGWRTAEAFWKLVLVVVGLLNIKLVLALLLAFGMGLVSSEEEGFDAVLVGSVLLAFIPFMALWAILAFAGVLRRAKTA